MGTPSPTEIAGACWHWAGRLRGPPTAACGGTSTLYRNRRRVLHWGSWLVVRLHGPPTAACGGTSPTTGEGCIVARASVSKPMGWNYRYVSKLPACAATGLLWVVGRLRSAGLWSRGRLCRNECCGREGGVPAGSCHEVATFCRCTNCAQGSRTVWRDLGLRLGLWPKTGAWHILGPGRSVRTQDEPRGDSLFQERRRHRRRGLAREIAGRVPGFGRGQNARINQLFLIIRSAETVFLTVQQCRECPPPRSPSLPYIYGAPAAC